MNLSKYNEAKRQIVEILDDIIPSGEFSEKIGKQIEDMEALLEEPFKILVMGRFVSGKTSLINVLLGEKLFPENVLPSTGIITEIHYGEKKRFLFILKQENGKVVISRLRLIPYIQKL